MRLFIAVKLNDEIKDHLMKAIDALKCRSSKGNFTHRDNLHLTLVFLGEIGPERLEDIHSAIDRISGEPFLLMLTGFGRFKRNGGDIHWAGIEKDEMLFKIQKQLEKELRDAGFSLEDRDYNPHLTLGREVRLKDPSDDIYGLLTESRPEMTAARISLMKSQRVNGMLTYTEIYGKNLLSR